MDRADFAERFWFTVHQGYGPEPIELVPKLFVRADSPDALLGLLQLHTTATTAESSDLVINTSLKGFRLMADGSVDPQVSMEARALAEFAAQEILQLLEEPALEAYSR